MVIGFTTTYAISAHYHKLLKVVLNTINQPTNHHLSCEIESCLWRGVLDTTLCDKGCQWFSTGSPVSSTNKTDRHDIIEILLKVA